MGLHIMSMVVVLELAAMLQIYFPGRMVQIKPEMVLASIGCIFGCDTSVCLHTGFPGFLTLRYLPCPLLTVTLSAFSLLLFITEKEKILLLLFVALLSGSKFCENFRDKVFF